MENYMKYTLVIISLFLVNFAHAETCSTDTSSTTVDVLEDVNTKVPKALKGAQIIIRRADGKEEVLKAEDYKVVKRVQQFKVKERSVVQKLTCNKDPNKNLIMVGGRKDYTGLDTTVNGKTATVESKRGLVMDASFLRQKVLDTRLGLGAGVDTNGTVRGIVGFEF